MTLRELLQSVDAEAYASIPLFAELLSTKPEYGSGNRIEVKLINGEIAVLNVHVGSLGDIELRPANPDYPVFKVKDPENFQIWGTVIHLIRTFEKL